VQALTERSERRIRRQEIPAFTGFIKHWPEGRCPFVCRATKMGSHLMAARPLARSWWTSSPLPAWCLLVCSSTALMRGLGHGVHLGALDSIPPLHVVQAAGGAPLRRAWAAVANRALAALGVDDLRADGSVFDDHAMDAEVADRLTQPDAWEAVAAALQVAVANRSSHMWAWEDTPSSIAGGILDDETYDWFALVGAMLCTRGWPVVVDEHTLIEANQISGSRADETGTAGLAGVVELRRAGILADDSQAMVVYSGIRRSH
jgi:threonine synthase